MFPRHRLDTLTDGIFGVAMTLLVLEIRIPDSLDPHTDSELMSLLVGLTPKIWPYALSFAVLGGRWRAAISGRIGHAPVNRRYVTWTLVSLFLVTLIPFSTQVLGRFASLAPSVWLYTANLLALSLSSLRAARTLPDAERAAVDDNRISFALLFLSSGVVITLSLVRPGMATLGFLITGLTPIARRLANRSKPQTTADA